MLTQIDRKEEEKESDKYSTDDWQLCCLCVLSFISFNSFVIVV